MTENYGLCERCPCCESAELRWVGHTKHVRNKTAGNRNVRQCMDCAFAWYYAKTGRRMTARSYRVWGGRRTRA